MSAALLVVDAPSLLFRAFFALPESIRGEQDEPVNALLGSVNLVLQVVNAYEPRAVVLCFGPDAAPYRTALFPAYHAARPPMPEALAQQWSRAPGLYEALGWTVARDEEVEADDLLAAYARAEEQRGGRALLMTGDRDLFQCASQRTTILYVTTGRKGPEEIGPQEVRERYGIEPALVPDFIALRGDPSDGLPGAPGIGPKTAAELLARHGSLEGTLSAVARPLPAERPRLVDALTSCAAELRAFKQIAALRPPPVTPPPDRETDRERGAVAVRELGLRRLAERLEGGPATA